MRTVSVTTTRTNAAHTVLTGNAIPCVSLYQHIHYLIAKT